MAFVQVESTLLSAITAYAASLSSGIVVHLYSNNYQPLVSSLITDFTEADYTGYAEQPITGFAAASWASQGAAIVYGDTIATFQPSGTTLTTVCYGYYVTITVSMVVILIGGEKFASAIPMASPADQINIVPGLGISDALIPGNVF